MTLSKVGKPPLGFGVRIRTVLYFCICGSLYESVLGNQLKHLFRELYRALVFVSFIGHAFGGLAMQVYASHNKKLQVDGLRAV